MSAINLKSYFSSLYMPSEFHMGVVEEFHLPNSEEYVIQYSNTLSNGRRVYGLGTDSTRSLATLKAFAEFVERRAFLNHGYKYGLNSTNGIATHLFKTLAFKNAINELIERDSFLMHWYSETSFQEVSDIHTEALTNEIRKSDALGYTAKFFFTYLGLEETAVCFLISKSTGGFCLGLSSGRSRGENLKKSFLEASISLFLVEGNDKNIIDTDEFEPTLKHHRDYWLFNQAIPNWIFVSAAKIEYKLPDSNFKMHVLENSTFSTVAATCDGLIGITSGSASINDFKIVETRLKGLKTINIGSNLVHPIP